MVVHVKPAGRDALLQRGQLGGGLLDGVHELLDRLIATEASGVLDWEVAEVAVVHHVATHRARARGQRLPEVATQPRELGGAAFLDRLVLPRANEDERRGRGVHGKRVELRAQLSERLLSSRRVLQADQVEDEHGDRGLGRVQQIED